MKFSKAFVLCSASLASLSVPAYAQDAELGVEEQDMGGEIIVTARRRDESLQNVPQTVSAVTAATIEKLNLQNFKDIQAVVPGLTLTGGVTGSDTGFALRGVSFNTLAQTASPTVQFYVNEATTDSNLLFQSMYDIGQIEVLRGPQGTLRGRSAPSGAITLTTRKPSLNEVGGYAIMTGTTRGNINGNAAVSVPLIDDVLAIRVAGLVDHNEADGVRSVNNGAKPFNRTESFRVSALLQPTDSVTASVTYQYLAARYRTFPQVMGFASPYSSPAGEPALNLAAGGPVITAEDRLGVTDGARETGQKFHLLTGNIDWGVAGQKLTYVGNYQRQIVDFASSPQDTFNLFPGFESYQNIAPTNSSVQSHELRLSNEDRIGGFLDYTVGGYFYRQRGTVKGLAEPAAPAGQAASVFTRLSTDQVTREISFFGSVTAHIGDRTEITAGARHINYKFQQQGPYDVPGEGSSGCLFFNNSFFIGCLANYAQTQPVKDNAWVWNASVSHRFSDDFLVYGNVGTSYRAPFAIVLLSTTDAPGFQSASDLRFHPAETSTGYEVGFKSNFFDNRVRLNVSAYHQKYKNHSFYIANVPFYDVTTGNVNLSSLTATADAVVWGVDVEAAVRITERWNLSAGFSWANGRVDNDDVPCRDSNFDGIADNGIPTPAGFVGNGLIVARCASDQSISTAPEWSLNLQSEYSAPVSDNVDGFLRALFTYTPENRNNNRTFPLDDYGLLNLYAGIRSPNNAWEVSLFAKNLTNTTGLRSAGDILPYTVNYGGSPAVTNTIPVDYRSVSTTAPREFGLNVRYAFGSR